MYTAPASPLVATVAAQPHSALIVLTGGVDMTGEPALAGVIEALSRSRPDVVVVDLTAVTFVCSTFVNFVSDLHDAVPNAVLILRNPSRMARRLLAVTGLGLVVRMSDDAGIHSDR